MRNKLNVVVIGITDRPQSINVAIGLVKSRHVLSHVIFEKRFSNRFNSLKSIIKTLRKFSFKFLFTRIKELIELRFKQLINKEENFYQKLRKNNTEYIEVDKINDKLVENKLKTIKPDVIVLAGAPIVKQNIIDCAKMYTINIHRSLLPKYAGLDAIFWALYHGEDKIGATVHVVDEGIDSGEIILQEQKKVEKNDDIESLTNWYNNLAPDLIVKSLDLLCDQNFKFVPQDLSKRSYYSWPTKEQRKELEERLEKQ